MKIRRPRELLDTALKKAKRRFSTKGPSGREAVGKEATKPDETRQEPPQTKTPRAEALTKCNANLTPVAGSDALTLGMMLYQEHNAPENRQDLNLQRKPMEDTSARETAELPPKIVVSPASDQDVGREGSHHESFTKSDANDYRLDLGEKDVLIGDQNSESEEAKRPRVTSKRVTFKDASYNGATFDGASFKGACFDGAHFNGGSFNNVFFDGAIFDGSSFSGGSFQGASFNRASFKGATFGQGLVDQVDDQRSVTTEVLDHIYGDPKDKHVTWEDSEQHIQPQSRDDYTPADGRIDDKDALEPEHDEASHKSGDADESTKSESHSDIDRHYKDADQAAKDEPRSKVEDTMGQTSFHEFETPPLELNYEALKHTATTFFAHGLCTNITTLPRGGFHEIRVLHFEDGWTCIARFTRDYEMLCKTESELATIEYVRTHTSIPVPQIYLVNYNENHVVGAPFVLMEYLDGEKLSTVWKDLTLEQKLDVVGQVAHVLGQLSELKFDAIGSLKADGTLGPLLNMTEERKAMADEAFTSTRDFFFAFLKDDHPEHTLAAREHYPAIREELASVLEDETMDQMLSPPYRLIHSDFDSQNILVLQKDPSSPPTISGIIDWDWSYTGPLYYLFEYPGYIQDDVQGGGRDFFAENKVLRKHFVASLIEYFPENTLQRKLVKKCFREKCFALSRFEGTFMKLVWAESLKSLEGIVVNNYLHHIRGEGDECDRAPYGGRLDWERDSDLTDSDAESSQYESGDESSMESSDHTSSMPSEEEIDEGSDKYKKGPQEVELAA